MSATSHYETAVAGRFDALESRFKSTVPAGDFRLRAVLDTLGDVAGLRLLDLGSGKGRFARRLEELGAEVVGVDRSAGMLAHAVNPRRVRASATRLPFPAAAFDAALAIETFEHLPAAAIARVVGEVRRVIRPGGVFVLIDKNTRALDARRPWLPAVVVKHIDERRGLWMYPAGGPVNERWFAPRSLREQLARAFADVRYRFLLADAEAGNWVHRRIPPARRFVAWTGRVPGEDD